MDTLNVLRPNTGDIFQLNMLSFRGDRKNLKPLAKLVINDYNSFSIATDSQVPVARVVEYRVEHYTLKDLLKLFWNIIMRNPKTEYLKVEWIES